MTDANEYVDLGNKAPSWHVGRAAPTTILSKKSYRKLFYFF